MNLSMNSNFCLLHVGAPAFIVHPEDNRQVYKAPMVVGWRGSGAGFGYQANLQKVVINKPAQACFAFLHLSKIKLSQIKPSLIREE